MAVFRVEKNSNYTTMCNYHLRDQNLSLKAKGLLSLFLSLPDAWHYSIRGIVAISKEGVDSVNSTLRELGGMRVSDPQPEKAGEWTHGRDRICDL